MAKKPKLVNWKRVIRDLETAERVATDRVGGIYRSGPAAFHTMKDARAAVEAMVIKDADHG